MVFTDLLHDKQVMFARECLGPEKLLVAALIPVVVHITHFKGFNFSIVKMDPLIINFIETFETLDTLCCCPTHIFAPSNGTSLRRRSFERKEVYSLI